MAREDYYSMLGIDRHAPEREVKRAYYKIARDLHPDKAKTPEEARANAEQLATISKAYNTLKDPQKRAEYDASLTGGGRPASSPTGRPASGASDVNPAAKTPPPADPPTAPGAAAASPKPAAPAQSAAAPQKPAVKISANDLQSQRVLTAQKAFVKGMEFYKNADFKKAVPFFEAAVTNDPESEAQYHMKLAQSLMKSKGSFSRAVQAAEKACEMDTYNMDFKIGLGEIYETVGVTSKAIVVYEDILKWEPDNEKAKLRLSLLKSAEREKNAGFLAKVFPSLFKK